MSLKAEIKVVTTTTIRSKFHVLTVSETNGHASASVESLHPVDRSRGMGAISQLGAMMEPREKLTLLTREEMQDLGELLALALAPKGPTPEGGE